MTNVTSHYLEATTIPPNHCNTCRDSVLDFAFCQNTACFSKTDCPCSSETRLVLPKMLNPTISSYQKYISEMHKWGAQYALFMNGLQKSYRIPSSLLLSTLDQYLLSSHASSHGGSGRVYATGSPKQDASQ